MRFARLLMDMSNNVNHSVDPYEAPLSMSAVLIYPQTLTLNVLPLRKLFIHVLVLPVTLNDSHFVTQMIVVN